MSLLGIIGGMGVQATARFYNMLIDMQNVKTEQEYQDVLIYSKASIPDRTAYITGESDISPLGPMLDAAKTLEKAGVRCIAMPCVTAHFFYESLVQAIKVPIINIMEETAIYVQKCGYSKVGLLATEGTLHGGLFQRAFARHGNHGNHGIDVVLPGAKGQDFLQEAIYNTKRGDMPVNALESLSEELYDAGANAIVLGCTELGLLQRCKGYIYIEAMEVLARALLEREVQNEDNLRVSGEYSPA